MAGYSGTPLPRKLGIKPGHSVAFPAAPPSFFEVLGELPDGVRIKQRAAAPLDLVCAFFTRRASLVRSLDRLALTLHPDGGLWIAWPKRASGMATDITEDVVRGLALAGGLVDNKVCAIDHPWSGLRLVYRLRDRPRS